MGENVNIKMIGEIFILRARFHLFSKIRFPGHIIGIIGLKDDNFRTFVVKFQLMVIRTYGWQK